MARLDGRHVQDIIQNNRKPPGRVSHQPQPLLRGGIGGLGKFRMAKTQDGVQRGAQLMAHLRQEPRLGLISHPGAGPFAGDFGVQAMIAPHNGGDEIGRRPKGNEAHDQSGHAGPAFPVVKHSADANGKGH